MHAAYEKRKRKRGERRYVFVLESVVVMLAVLLTMTIFDEPPASLDMDETDSVALPENDAASDSATATVNEVSALDAEAEPGIGVDLVKSMAWQELASGNYREAIAQYNVILAALPDYAQALMERGIARASSGDHEGAVGDYTAAIERAAYKALPYYNRGVSYDEMGMPQAAIADYTQAIAHDDSYVNAWTNRGYVYANLGNWARAFEDFNAAVELDANYAIAWNSRGAAHSELGDLEAARADYERAIELDPDYENAHYNYGILMVGQGDFERALHSFELLIQSDIEKTPDMWNNHGSALHMLGQYSDAIESYSEALLIDAAYQRSRVNRAYAYRDLGDYQAAVMDFSIALENGWMLVSVG